MTFAAAEAEGGVGFCHGWGGGGTVHARLSVAIVGVVRGRGAVLRSGSWWDCGCVEIAFRNSFDSEREKVIVEAADRAGELEAGAVAD